jgi:hypothetical protein
MSIVQASGPARGPSGVATRGVAWVWVTAAVLAAPLHGQSSIVFAAGPSLVDHDGAAIGPGVAMRFERQVYAGLHLELGGALVRSESESGSGDNLVLPELGLRKRFPLGAWAAHLAGGAGAHVTVVDRRDAELTLFAAAALERPLSGPWTFQAEMRARALDPWERSMVDLTVGLRRRLGG